MIALDVASSEFYKEGMYDLDFKNPNSDPTKWVTGVELADLYISYIKSTPLSRSRTHSARMTGRHGPTLPLKLVFRSSAMI